jgi:hypothetical protein
MGECNRRSSAKTTLSPLCAGRLAHAQSAVGGSLVDLPAHSTLAKETRPLVKIVPLRLHGGVEIVVGLSLATVPWVLSRAVGLGDRGRLAATASGTGSAASSSWIGNTSVFHGTASRPDRDFLRDLHLTGLSFRRGSPGTKAPPR